MVTNRRFVQITDKEINKIKITCAKILKQLFASGSVILLNRHYFTSAMLIKNGCIWSTYILLSSHGKLDYMNLQYFAKIQYSLQYKNTKFLVCLHGEYQIKI